MSDETIKLALSVVARVLSQRGFSSGDYQDFSDSFLSPLDLLYTFTARYDKLVEADLP